MTLSSFLIHPLDPALPPNGLFFLQDYLLLLFIVPLNLPHHFDLFLNHHYSFPVTHVYIVTPHTLQSSFAALSTISLSSTPKWAGTQPKHTNTFGEFWIMIVFWMLNPLCSRIYKVFRLISTAQESDATALSGLTFASHCKTITTAVILYAKTYIL